MASAAFSCVILLGGEADAQHVWGRVGTVDSSTATNNALCTWNSSGAGTLECSPGNPYVIGGAFGIGTALPNAAAALDVFSTSQGLLPPRMTNAQEIAIGTNANSGGLLVYNTTLNELDVYDSATGQWEAVGANAADAAGSTGDVQFNSGGDLAASANFFWDNTHNRLGIGTATMASAFEVNGNESIGYVDTAAPSNGLLVKGNVGIGTTSPDSSLQVSTSGSSANTISIIHATGNDTSGGGDFIISENTATTGQPIAGFQMRIAGAAYGNFFASGTAIPSYNLAEGVNFSVGTFNGTQDIGFRTILGGGSGTGPQMIIKSSGNVGIGTTSPQALLDVLQTTNSSSGGLRIATSNNSNSIRIWDDASGNGRISASTLESSSILLNGGGTGSVGIGTTSPTLGLLHLYQSANSNTGGLTIQNSAASGSTRLWEDASAQVRLDGNGGNDGNIVFNGTGTGRVGIGTTSPQNTLHVNGGIIATGSGVIAPAGAGPAISMYDNSSTGYITSAFTGTAFEPLVAEALSISFLSGPSQNQGFYQSSTGNVGFGTTSPKASLQVGTMTTTSSGISTIAYLGGSNVGGIVYPLTVTNMATPTVGNEAQITFTDCSSCGPTGAIGNVMTNAGNSASDLRFLTYTGSAFSEMMRIQGSTGNVGIGTTTPLSKLSVAGNLALGAYGGGASTTAAPSNGLIVSGQTGIGTAAPNAAAALDVFSTTQGLLPPRVTAAQEIAIGTNVSSGGLLVYNTTLNELDVYDSATGQWEAVGANAADAAGSTGQVQFNSGGDLAADSNFFWDNTNKRLGIGTTSPAGIMDIYGSSPTVYIRNNALNAGTNTLYFAHDGASPLVSKLAIITQATGAWSQGNMYFAVNGANDGTSATVSNALLTLTASGLVGTSGKFGAGTAAPNDLMEVRGASAFATINTADNATTAGLRFSHIAATTAQKVAILAPAEGAFGRSTGLFFAIDSANDVTNADTTYTKMVILENGNIGIGTTTPDSALSVNGGAAIGSYAGTNAAPSNGLIVSGAFGIGTALPNAAAALDVFSTSQGLLPPRMTNAQEIAIGTNANSGGLLVYNTTLNELDVYDSATGQWEAVGANAADAAGSTGQVQFNSGGDLGASANFFWDNTHNRLGIGTSTMASAFEVNGNESIGYVDTAAPSNGLIVSGNVGIGVTSPGYSLVVNTAGGTTIGTDYPAGTGLVVNNSSAGNTTAAAAITGHTTGSGGSAELLMGPIGSSQSDYLSYTYSNNSFAFRINNTTEATLSSTGLGIGLGNSLPSYVLHLCCGTQGAFGSIGLEGGAFGVWNQQILWTVAGANSSTVLGQIQFQTFLNSTVVTPLTLYGNYVGVGITTPVSLLNLGGDISASAWTTTGIDFATNAATYTDTSTASGTVTTREVNSLGLPTLASTNAITVTNGSNLYIAGGAVQGTNTTLTNSYGEYIAAGAVGAATNSYGLYVNAQTGATNNYGAVFATGNVGIATTAPLSTLSVAGNLAVGTYGGGAAAAAAPSNGLIVSGFTGIGTATVQAPLWVHLATNQDFGVRSSGGITQIYGATDSNGSFTTFAVTGNPLILNAGTGSGNVSIGTTTSPLSMLSVYGGVGIGTTYSTTNNAGTNNLIVQGNVGIGTTAPQSKLQILSGEVQVGSSGNSCTGNNAGAISYSSNALNYCNGSIWAAVGGGGVTTFSAGTTGFTPNSATSGAVTLAGILNTANGGTGSSTAPAYSLFGNNIGTTAAPAYQTAPILSGAVETLQTIGTTSTDGIMLYDTTAATASIQQFSPRLHFEGQGWKTNATAASQNVDMIQELQTASGAAAPTGNLTWSTAVGTTTFSPLMTLTSGGNVGIGTTSPTNNLHIAVNSASTAGLRIENANAAGYAGLNVYYNGTVAGNMTYANPSSPNGDGNTFEISSGSGIPIDFWAGFNSIKMRITAAGNVGIGTTTMASKFEVNGNANIGYVDTAAPSNGLIVSGNVGIGTTSPAAMLHTIAGDNTSTSYPVTGGGTFYADNQLSVTNMTAPAASSNTNANLDYVVLNPAAPLTAASVVARFTSLVVPSTSTNGDTAGLTGTYTRIYNYGSGTLGNLLGTQSSAVNFGTASIGSIYGLYVSDENQSTGNQTATVTSSYAIDASSVNATTNGTIGTQYGIYDGATNSGTVTNGYGLYITGWATGGTHTNTPFDLYAADTGTYNYFAGKVGIGTTAPQSKLQILSGEVQVGSSGASCTGNTSGAIRYSGGTLYFCDASNTWESIDSSGGADTGDYYIATQTATPTTGQGMFGGSSTLGGVLAGYGSTADVTLENRSNAAAFEVLANSTNVEALGNLGIGSSSPAVALDLVGVEHETNVNIGTTSTDGIELLNSTAATASIQQYSPRLHFEGQGWKTAATAASQNVDFIQEVQSVSGSAAPTGNLVWSTAVGTTTFNPLMTLTSGGNVGIGTTSPTAALSIQTPSASTSGIVITDSTNQTAPNFQLMRIDAVKMLELKRGTGSFAGQLSLYDTSANETKLYASGALYIDTGQTATMRLAPSGSDIFFQNTTSSGKIWFTGNNSAVLTGNVIFNTSGNLGIGTTTPDSSLSVNGGAAIGSYAGTNAAPSNGLIVSGNVGIGTASPTSLLQTSDSVAKTSAYTGILHDVFDTSTTASVNKVGMDIESTGTWIGTSATNTGLVVNATGGTTNYAATFNGGNVGIGVTSPTASLQVGSGQIFAPDGTGSAPGYSFSNAGSTGIANVSGKLRFSMGGQTQIGMDSTNLRLGSGASLTWENNAQALSGTVDTNLSRVSAGVLGVGTGAQGSTAGTLLAGIVGIGTAAPNAAAALDVFSTSQGFLPPRMTNAQEIAIGTNANSGGLLVYNTTLNELDVYDSATGQWEAVGANAADAAGSTGQVQFNSGGDLGASANFFWDNTHSRLGIGTATMASAFEVNGNESIGYADTAAPSNGLLVKGIVGIGNTNPSYTLDVTGATAGGNIMELTQGVFGLVTALVANTTSNAAAGARFLVTNDLGGGNGLEIGKFSSTYSGTGVREANFGDVYDSSAGLNLAAGGSSGVIRFYTGGTASANEQARITSTGLVGIGTASPTSLLQTSDSAAKTAAYTGILHDVFDTSTTASVKKVGMDIESTGVWTGTSSINTGLVVNATGGTTNYAATFSGGNVGIGITNPGFNLEITGANPVLYIDGTGGSTAELDLCGNCNNNIWKIQALATSGMMIQNSNSGATPLFAAAYGGLGINNLAPTSRLQISSALSLAAWATTGTMFSSDAVTTTDNNSATSATVTTRTANSFGSPTFASTNTITVTNGSNLYVAGGVVKGTNTTLTNSYGEYIAAGAVGAATNSYGLYVNAQTGATNNYGAVFASGNVGIGTTAPQSALQILSGEVQVGSSGNSCTGNNAGAISYSSNALNYCNGSIWTAVGGGGGGSGTVTSSTAGQVAYYQSTGTTVIGTSTITISAGKVGIGSTSPAVALDLAGVEHETNVSIGTTSTDGIDLINSTAATASIQQFSPRLHFEGQGWKTNATAASQNVDFIQEVQTASGAAAPTGNLTWSTAVGTTTFSPIMTLTSGGSVGIGTASPLSALHVEGTTGITWTASGDSSGLATFGTGGSGGSLWVNTPSVNASFQSGFGVTGSYGTPVSRAVINLSAYGPNTSGAYGSDMAFSTTKGVVLSEAMRIDKNGFVGIGTTTPSGHLDVRGNVYIIDSASGSASSPSLVIGDSATSGNYLIVYGDSADGGTMHIATSYNVSDGPLAFGTFTTPNTMTLLPSGNVGIGTTSPGFPVDIWNTPSPATNTVFEVADAAAGAFENSAQFIAPNMITGSENIISVGKSAATNNWASFGFFYAGNNSTSNRLDILFFGGSTPMSLMASGNVGIGNTSPAHLLHVGSASASGAVAAFQNSADLCTLTPASSTPTWSCSSDIRLKTDIADTGDAVALLDGMRVRDFTMKATGERQTGVIAQELATAHPDMVRMGSNGFLTVDSPNPWMLVKAIQELKADNDNLRTANDNLSARVATLEAKAKQR